MVMGFGLCFGLGNWWKCNFGGGLFFWPSFFWPQNNVSMQKGDESCVFSETRETSR